MAHMVYDIIKKITIIIMDCTRCNDKPAKCKKMCISCYYATKRGVKTYKEMKLERNFVRDGVGILTDNKGNEHIVDLEDFENCKNYLWVDSGNGYAKSSRVGFLHRFILNDAAIVDHINKDTRDNRRANLREGEYLNSINKTHKLSTSGYRGVHKMRDKFQASIRYAGKRHFGGTFNTAEEAYEKVLDIAESLNIKQYYII